MRRRGFAVNDQLTETGLTAVGRARETAAGGEPSCRLTAMPTARFDRDLPPSRVGAISAAVTRIEEALTARG
ncbi:hypothetical protein ACFOWE_12240 [Planomonospora corallina]|uniref:IclR-ED domain-containing protein n=1 Tax=Planomonospora corallina TaxID=1806052 RepID=A0ABV8I4Q2_9ACTN